MFSEKQLFVTGDININSLAYESNNIVKNFFNASFKIVIFPVNTRPTSVTRHSSTVIDHILTNAILTKIIPSENGYFRSFSFFSYIDEKIILNRKGEETIFKLKINNVF